MVHQGGFPPFPDQSGESASPMKIDCKMPSLKPFTGVREVALFSALLIFIHLLKQQSPNIKQPITHARCDPDLAPVF